MLLKTEFKVHTILTDFSEAFDSVDHNSLIYILSTLGIGDPLLSRIHSYLVDRLDDNLFGVTSKNFKVSSGIT